ncbi:MAG: hypothetical protein GF416_04975 [Candidatus Altiarchaeales archaeon]|nr:hypothetical protein [Candidatus Altiarchaeales archaeon]MBD3416470.1 hypothetical protein [Candidatus Altiarchaeales archaeon]
MKNVVFWKLTLALAIAITVSYIIILAGIPAYGHPEDSEERGPVDSSDATAKLLSLGYLSHARESHDRGVGVTVYDRVSAYDGLNLFTNLWTSEVLLMDMNGSVRHTWTLDGRYWHHAVEDNMSLVGLAYRVVDGDVEGSIVRMDKGSNIIWKSPGTYHHGVWVTDDGRVYSIDGSKTMPGERRNITVGGRGYMIVDNHIVELSPSGEVVDSVSVFDLVEDLVNNETMAEYGDYLPFEAVEVLHTNYVEEVREDLGYANEGDVLFCVRNLDLIGIADMDEEKLVWHWGPGVLEHPHSPSILDGGNILVFDNGVRRGYSRVLELDPRTGEVVWEYEGSPPESFYSESRGWAQRLPNNNTLITESDMSRVFEVTREGRIVWEYWNTHADDENRTAIICSMQRIG